MLWTRCGLRVETTRDTSCEMVNKEIAIGHGDGYYRGDCDYYLHKSGGESHRGLQRDLAGNKKGGRLAAFLVCRQNL